MPQRPAAIHTRCRGHPNRPSALPANPFYTTADQRIALARRNFFEDGLRPSGLVSEAVLQSWSRCLRLHDQPTRPAVFEPVTAGRAQTALRCNRVLLDAAGPSLARLHATLAGTSSTAMLTDARGIVIGSTFTQARSHEHLMPLATRVGVNLAEDAVGTTAPGLTARTAQASQVQGAEHYFGNAHTMHCAAAPIRDRFGLLAGVLDLSSECLAFGFDASAVVAHYAADIENRLLRAQSQQHLVVCLQIAPELLDTPLVAMLGILGDGRIDWMNGAAARLLGLATSGQAMTDGHALMAEDCLGQPLAGLLAAARRAVACPVSLPNGLRLWMRCEGQARDGLGPLHPVAAAIPRRPQADAAPLAQVPPGPGLASASTLRDRSRDAVTRALADANGNIARAARSLGVSRGLIYRQLRSRSG